MLIERKNDEALLRITVKKNVIVNEREMDKQTARQKTINRDGYLLVVILEPFSLFGLPFNLEGPESLGHLQGLRILTFNRQGFCALELNPKKNTIRVLKTNVDQLKSLFHFSWDS